MKATIYEFINEMSEAELRRAARVASDEYFNEECTRENLAVNMLRWILEAELNAGTLTKQEIIAAAEIPNPVNTPTTMNEQTKQYFRNVYGTYENLCEQADEYLARLRYELQQYKDNASKGGAQRRRNMEMLQQDIKNVERQKEECKQAFAIA